MRAAAQECATYAASPAAQVDTNLADTQYAKAQKAARDAADAHETAVALLAQVGPCAQLQGQVRKQQQRGQGWNPVFSSGCNELGIKTFGKDQESFW